MRKTTWLALAALFAVPVAVAAQDNSQPSAAAQSSQSSQASQPSSSAAQQDPLAAAARKARAKQKNAPKSGKVFDNDNLPTEGGISTVGEASAPEKTEKSGKTAAQANPLGKEAAAEWRAKFAGLRKQLQTDQSELSVMQRELSQQMLQYYGGDPQKAVQDQQSRKPLGDKYDQTKAAIDAKQKQVDADQQAISDAEDALRKAGGDPGWER